MGSRGLLPTRDDIATMTLEEYEHRLCELKEAGFRFTVLEKSEIVAARRMIRNRFYARTTRQKKREQLEFLEGRVCQLEAECYALRREMIRMQHEHVKSIGLPSIPSQWETQSVFNPYDTDIDTNVEWCR